MKRNSQQMRTVCEKNMCNGCMACLNVCNKGAIEMVDSLEAYNAIIDINKCVDCHQCERVCPRNNRVIAKEPIKWMQGWASNEVIRQRGSSGGFATAIMQTFISVMGGYVFSCSFQNGDFCFKLATTPEACFEFSGSKYIKSNPCDIYKEIKKLLTEGEKVLFLGLPCQVAGVKNFIGEKNRDNLYTIDLICHGTPSPQLLDRYLKEQFEQDLCAIDGILFRVKNHFNLHDNKGKMFVPRRVQDRYTIAFLDSLDYTENCYHCDYANIGRISDISLGDSWASGLSGEEQCKGISLALCQTQKGLQLLESADLVVLDVDIDEAIRSNRQLMAPSQAPRRRKKFFGRLMRGMHFGKAVFLAYPKLCLKQDIKIFLFRLGVHKGN